MNAHNRKSCHRLIAALLLTALLIGFAGMQTAQAVKLLDRHIVLSTVFASSPAGGGMTATSEDFYTGTGAWRSANQLIEYYIDPTLPPYSFGSIKVSDIDSVSYMTKNGDALAVNIGFYIYTAGTKYGWYQERLIAEPMYSINYSDPADTWNAWSTDEGPNQLAFYDSHYSAMGFYYGPTLADIQAAPITWSEWDTNTGSTTPIDYRNQVVKYFKFGTGSAWSANFDGLIDTIVINLKNGDSLSIDLEQTVPTVYVDDDWSRFGIGQDPDGDSGPVQGIGLDAATSIQQGIDMASAGGRVNVFPGNYSETAANRTVLDLGGVYQFGLFFDADKPGLTVQGVDASGAVITDYADVVANVTTNATNNFGPSGVFVEGDDVTLSGLRILPNTGGDNKTIEVIGDNFSLEASVIDVAGGGSVYLNDWRFDSDTNTSYLQSYTILNNLFAQSASLDIASGAGYTGPVSGRVIQGNRFEYTADAFWPAISFSGNSVVPWFTDPVNGATITGNTFAGTTQHIRARGGYDNATFDWLGYRANNTFEKTVLAFVGNTTEVRSYEYETSYGTMDNVRRLTASIQFGVDDAIDGDTVDVSAGTFTEQVVISEDIRLQGVDGASIIQAYNAMPSCFSLPSAANNRPVVCVKDTDDATITGFTVDGLGLGNTNNRFYGIAFRNAGGTVQDTLVRDIRNTPFDGVQHGVGIYAYNDDATARTLHILDNTVTGFQKNGITINASAANVLTIDVQRNTVAGQGATTITAQNGIQVNAPAGSGLIAGNTISGIAYDNTDAATKWVATSILNYYTDVDTTGNVITGAHMGIYYYDGFGLIENNDLTIEKIGVYAYGINAADPPQAVPAPFDAPVRGKSVAAASSAAPVIPVEIAHNTLTFEGADQSSTYAIEADAGYGDSDLAVNVHHNTVKNFEYGLVFYQCTEDCGLGVFESISAVSNDLIDNVVGIYFGGAIPADVVPVIHHNRIFGDVATDTGLVSELTDEINAENNWWGCSAGPADEACLNTIGLVDADPWLVLTFTADQTKLIPGGVIHLTADLNRNSAGADTSAQGAVMDGLLISFDTTYGTLDPHSAGLVNASAATTLSVPTPVTVTSATVSALFDNQVVEIVFGGQSYIYLPIISR